MRTSTPTEPLKAKEALLLAWLGPFLLASSFNVSPWVKGVDRGYANKLRGVAILVWMEILLLAAIWVTLWPRGLPDENGSLEAAWIVGCLAILVAQSVWLAGKAGDRYRHAFEALPKRLRFRLAVVSGVFFLAPAAYFFWAV